MFITFSFCVKNFKSANTIILIYAIYLFCLIY